MIYVIDHSIVKVPNTVEIHIAHVVSKDITYFLTILNHFPLKILLTPFLDFSYFYKPIESIFLVFKLYFTVYPVIQSTHGYTIEGVFWVIASYCLSIVEDNFFMSELINIYSRHRKTYSLFIITRKSVISIRSLYENMRSWRVMRSLFNEEISAIRTFCLVSLTKYGV